MTWPNDKVLPTHTKALFEAAVDKACELLRQGELAALPTETVYGLAANALDAEAVKKIFELKKRPSFNPLIVHVASIELAKSCANVWPVSADILSAHFWPGPLTLVLPKAPHIPSIVTAGGATVAIRWPSHPFMQAVIRRCGFPLAAPSANRANQLSPTSAEHVLQSFGQDAPLVVDGGHCQVGIESTVVDLTGPEAVVLRPGMITPSRINALIPLSAKPGRANAADSREPMKSPGQFSKHYAPRASLHVLAWRTESGLISQLHARNIDPSGCHVVAHSEIPQGKDFAAISVIPPDPEAYARALYHELHRCDLAGAQWIIMEAVPETEEWHAVRDRLARATAED